MAKANGLNNNLQYCINYPASSLNFNLTTAQAGGSDPSFSNRYVRSSTSGSCVWWDPKFSPGNASIGYPNAINSFVTSSISVTSAYLGSGSGLLTFTSSGLPSIAGGNSSNVTLVSGATSIAGNTPTLSTGSGVATASITYPGTGYYIDLSLFSSSTATGALPLNSNIRVIAGTVGSPRAFSLPATSSVGDCIRIATVAVGANDGIYRISQGAGQYIYMGNLGTTTVGTGGYIQNLRRGIGLELICVVANTGWALCGNVMGPGFTIV